MLRFALRHFDQQQPLALQFSVISVDANSRFDGIRANLNQNRIQRDDLFTRQALNLTCVGNAAEQHATIRIGKSSDLIGQIIAAWTSWPIPGKRDLLKFPLAVLAQAQLARNTWSL